MYPVDVHRDTDVQRWLQKESPAFLFIVKNTNYLFSRLAEQMTGQPIQALVSRPFTWGRCLWADEEISPKSVSGRERPGSAQYLCIYNERLRLWRELTNQTDMHTDTLFRVLCQEQWLWLLICTFFNYSLHSSNCYFSMAEKDQTRGKEMFCILGKSSRAGFGHSHLCD